MRRRLALHWIRFNSPYSHIASWAQLSRWEGTDGLICVCLSGRLYTCTSVLMCRFTSLQWLLFIKIYLLYVYTLIHPQRIIFLDMFLEEIYVSECSTVFYAHNNHLSAMFWSRKTFFRHTLYKTVSKTGKVATVSTKLKIRLIRRTKRRDK